jgi:ubiquinone/menaquinone biosynthesis C-methylase UbiE
MALRPDPDAEQRAHWNAAWQSAKFQSFSVHTRLIEKIKWRYLQADLTGFSGWSLEVGCGSGHLSNLMSGLGFRTLLLDYSPSALACAQNSFKNSTARYPKSYVLGDALALPLAGSSVDVVVSGGVIEHFRDPVVAIREMARVLRPGGLLYADICPWKFSLIRLLDFLYPSAPGWYERKMSKREIAEMIQASGLRLRRLFAAGVLPPRLVPGRGRIKAIDAAVRWSVERWQHFWQSLDATRLAEWAGLYYHVSAIKPDEPAGRIMRNGARRVSP